MKAHCPIHPKNKKSDKAKHSIEIKFNLKLNDKHTLIILSCYVSYVKLLNNVF